MTGRIVTTLLAVEIVAAMLLGSVAVVRAIDLNDLGISRPESLDVNKIVEDAGLDSARYAACAGSIGDMFADLLSGTLDNLKDEAINFLKGFGLKKLGKTLGCAASNNFFTSKFGTTPCVKVTESDVKAELLAEIKQRLRSNFLVGCTAAAGRDAVTGTITAMLHQWGPDGGLAYVLDYTTWFNIRPEKMAQRRMWAILVNADICSEFRDVILDAARVPQEYRDNPPSLGADGLAVNGDLPPALRFGCNIPAGTDFATMDPIEAIELRAMDGNNPDSVFAMYQAEWEEQVRAMKTNADKMSADGFLPTQDACQKDPTTQRECIRDGATKLVGGAVQLAWAGDVKAAMDAQNLATGEQGLLNDIASQIQVRLLDLANAPLPLVYESGAEQRTENYPKEPVPTPEGPLPTPDSDDPACSNPACSCPPDGYEEWLLMSKGFVQVIAEVGQLNPGLFIGGTSEIAAGRERDFLQAVCVRSELLCHPHPWLNDRLVVDLADGVQASFRLITSDGFARTDGGDPIALCTDNSM